MTFEATLQSIDASLKALVVMAQTGSSAAHTFGVAADAAHAAANVGFVASLAVSAAKAPRKTKEPVGQTSAALESEMATAATNPLGLVPGDPEGTRYWVIEKHNTVYAQKPGDIDCSIEGAKIESAAFYLEKKAEFAKKSLIPPLAAAPSTAPAAASTPAATAATASPSVATPSFKDVTDKLIELSKDVRPGKGREALVALLAKYLPEVEATARKVPTLSTLGKNTEIMAEVLALLAPDAEVEVDIFG